MPVVRIDYQSDHAVVVSGMQAIRREATRTAAHVKSAFKGVDYAGMPGGAVARTGLRRQSARTGGRSMAEKAAQQAARAYNKEIRAAERAERQKTRIMQREARRRWALQRRNAERAFRLYQRNSRREMTERRRRLSKIHRERSRLAGRGMSAGLGAVGAVGAAALGLGGAIARKSIMLDDYARRVAIKGGDPSQGAALRRSFERTAVDVKGSKALDIGQASAAFVSKTGNLGAAKQFQTLFAEISLAADASAEDIGAAAAAAFDAFDIKTVDDMRLALATFTVQGKRNAFEMTDLADKLPRIAAAGRAFGLKSDVKSLASLTGLTQIAMKGTGNADVASAAVIRTLSSLTKNAVKLEKDYGIDTSTGNLPEILSQTIAKAGGSDEKKKRAELLQVFGDRGIKAINPLISAYMDAVKQGKDGADVVKAMMAKASDAAGAEAEVRRDLVAAQQTTSAQLTHAWESLTAAIGPRLIPMVASAAAHLASFVESTDFGPVLQGLDALAYALRGVANFLKDAGLIKDRKLTPEEQERNARRKGMNAQAQLDRYINKAKSGKALSAQESAEAIRLQAEVDKQRSIEQKAAAQLDAGPAKDTSASFVKKLTDAGVEEQQARSIARQIRADPTKGVGNALNAVNTPTGAGLARDVSFLGPMAAAAGLAVSTGAFAASGLGIGRNDEASAAIESYGGQVTHERNLDVKPLQDKVDQAARALELASTADEFKRAVEAMTAAMSEGASKTNALAVPRK